MGHGTAWLISLPKLGESRTKEVVLAIQGKPFNRWRWELLLNEPLHKNMRPIYLKKIIKSEKTVEIVFFNII